MSSSHKSYSVMSSSSDKSDSMMGSDNSNLSYLLLLCVNPLLLSHISVKVFQRVTLLLLRDSPVEISDHVLLHFT